MPRVFPLPNLSRVSWQGFSVNATTACRREADITRRDWKIETDNELSFPPVCRETNVQENRRRCASGIKHGAKSAILSHSFYAHTSNARSVLCQDEHTYIYIQLIYIYMYIYHQAPTGIERSNGDGTPMLVVRKHVAFSRYRLRFLCAFQTAGKVSVQHGVNII